MAHAVIQLKNNTNPARPIALVSAGFGVTILAGATRTLPEDIDLIRIENSDELNNAGTGYLKVADDGEPLSILTLIVDGIEYGLGAAGGPVTNAYVGESFFPRNEFVSVFTGNAGEPVVTNGSGLIASALLGNNADVISNTNARHTQGTDLGLDTGGSNPITAATLKGHVDNVTTNPHAVTKTNVGLGNVPNVDATNADNISSGTLNIGRIPTGTTGTTVALGNHTHVGVYEPVIAAGTTAQYWRGDKSWQTLDKAAVGLGNVPNVDATNATNISSGTLNIARIPTGTTGTTVALGDHLQAVANGGTGQTTYTNGQLLIGNSTGNTLTKASLTAGTGVTITPGAGSITIAATGASAPPQSYTVFSTGTDTVTSSSYADVPSMAKTVPVAGTYLLNFSASFSLNTSITRDNDFIVSVDGSEKAESVRSEATTNNGWKHHIAISCLVTTTAINQIVKIRARSSNGDTISVYERTMTLVRVTP